jgi:hypothetical protein
MDTVKDRIEPDLHRQVNAAGVKLRVLISKRNGENDELTLGAKQKWVE